MKPSHRCLVFLALSLSLESWARAPRIQLAPNTRDAKISQVLPKPSPPPTPPPHLVVAEMEPIPDLTTKLHPTPHDRAIPLPARTTLVLRLTDSGFDGRTPTTYVW